MTTNQTQQQSQQVLSELAKVRAQFQLQALIAALGIEGELKLIDNHQHDGVE